MSQEKLLRQFCEFDFKDRNCEKAVSLLTDDIHWFGTSDFEDVHSKEEARQYILNEIKKIPTPYQIEYLEEAVTPLGENGVMFLRMRLTHSGMTLVLRATAAYRAENGVGKICTMHFSVADAEQQNNEYFPLEQRQAKLAQERESLVLSTMAGGLVGGYCEEGFPFYFVNGHMLQYLGYSSEQEFVTDIHGLIENTIHPDDREMVNAVTKVQLNERGRYAVEYRMRRKDGSYIWVHDIGKTGADENGRAVIISVCYDITEQRSKQQQLDNIINAIPGGVAIYKISDIFQTVYFSKGVPQLSGYTVQE